MFDIDIDNLIFIRTYHMIIIILLLFYYYYYYNAMQ